MTTPTVPVTVTLAAQDGTPYEGVTVRARLDANEVYESIVISDQAEGVTDANGVAVLDLFPNAPSPTGLGTQGTTYRFTAAIPGGRALNVNARVPNTACRLENILVGDEIGDLSDAELALLQAQAAVTTAASSAAAAEADAIATAADRVQTGLDRVATGADRAVVEGIAADYGDISEAVAATQASAAAAEAAQEVAVDARAIIAADRLRAERARDTLEAEIAYVELLDGRTNGLSIDITHEDPDLEVKVLDTTTPVNNFNGTLADFMALSSITFTTPKLCLQEDGTLKYQPHNEILQSGDPSNASWTKLNITPTTGQVGPDGTTTDATLLTVSGSTTTPRIQQQPTVLANMQRRQELVVKAGTAPFVYLEVTNNAVTRRAWFNTATLAWATVDAGLTTGLSSTKEDGTAWATGWRSIAVYGSGSGGTTDTIRFGLSDTDGGTTCTLGRTATIAQIQSHRGVRRLPYLTTTTVSRRGIPYDWTHGVRSVRFDIQTAYKGRHSNDLTNAAWTPTNITPALNATGPAGEPCSTITATADNGTIIQSVTSSGTLQNFHAWVRRKTGTGTLSITIDNGASWTDATADVGAAGGDYLPVYKQGALANPTVGFRIGTSGDEFEVAYANVAQTVHLPPPTPSMALDVTASSDVFNVATTAFPTASAMTFYADLYIHESQVGGAGSRSHLGFYGAGSIRSTADINCLSGGIRMEHTWHDGTTNNDENFGDVGAAAGRLQIQHRYKSGDCALAINGNAAWWNGAPGSYTITAFKATFLQSMWLRRLVIVPEDIDDDTDDLRLFKLDETDANVNSSLLASAYVAKCVHGSTGILRIPDIEVLYERGDVCEFICTWGQRYTSGYNLEAPQRMMQRRGQFDRSTNTLTWLEDATTVLEPAGWATGSAGVQGYTTIKIKHGPYRGRLVRIYIQQDQAGGTPDNRNLYMMYSDDNGGTWSSGVKILDKSVFIGASAGFVATGENSTSFQISDPNNVHYGRVYVSLNANNQNFYAWWCDDFKVGGSGAGTNWTYSTTPVSSTSGGIGTLTEPALTFYPNSSTIVMLLRNSGGGVVGYSTSSDYGVTFATVQETNGDDVSWNVNCGLIQDDPTGRLGLRGRLILARSTLNGRLGHKIQSTKTADFNFAEADNYRLFSKERFIGYCPLKKAFEDDNIYLCMAEHQPTVTSNVNTSQMVAVFRY